MDIGIRFSSPIPEEKDIKLLAQLFDNNKEEIEKIFNNVPYEISVLACLLSRLEKFIFKIK